MPRRAHVLFSLPRVLLLFSAGSIANIRGSRLVFRGSCVVRHGVIALALVDDDAMMPPRDADQFCNNLLQNHRRCIQPEHDLFWMMPRQLCKWRLDNFTCISNCREILAVPIQPTCSEMEHMLIMPFYGRSFPLPSAHVVPRDIRSHGSAGFAWDIHSSPLSLCGLIRKAQG